MSRWTFITNHGLVLLYIWHHPQCTMREMATALGVTEKSIQRILEDLGLEGYVTWQRTGKGNIYEINHDRELKHELTRDVIIGDLLEFLGYTKKRKNEQSQNKNEAPKE